MKITTTKRSLDYMRKHGYMPWVVEQTIRIPDPKAPGGSRMFKRDMYNIFDLIAINPSLKIIAGIQTTSRANQAARITKIKEEHAEESENWIKSGGVIYVHGWKQEGRFWKVSIHEVVMCDAVGKFGAIEVSHEAQSVGHAAMHDTLFASSTPEYGGQ